MASTGPQQTVLQIQCGTCMQILSVPANLLESLLQAREYSCPQCSSRQAINLRPEQESALRLQARNILQQQLAAMRQQTFTQHMRAGLPQHQGPRPHPHQNPLQRPQQPMPRPPPGFMPRGPMPPFPRGSGLPRPPSASALNLALAQKELQALMAASNQQRQQQQNQQMQLQMQQLPGDMAAAFPEMMMFEEEEDIDEGEVRETFLEYKPAKLPYGLPHPDAVVETASLASVDPPDITYELKAHDILVDQARLSALQLESVVYACQRHEQKLPDGSRAAFFIGDGAGVGKGRTIAGLILENWRCGRKRHLWISVGSDLKFDARRDLDDAGADDIPVHPLNKLPYSKLDGNKVGLYEGVIFLTYSSLISSSEKGRSRFKQLIEWCGKDFDGLIVFDESHKAKNLVPEAGGRSTQVGLRVKDIQTSLPGARIVYCSATGASEPRNMGYMVRLGLWGTGHAAFTDFGQFLEAVQGKSGQNAGAMATLELVAMDMKAHGMYVARTLSFAGAEFETLQTPLEEPIASQYAAAAHMWNLLYREFLAAEEKIAALAQNYPKEDTTAAPGGGPAPSGVTAVSGGGRKGEWKGGSPVWRYFWAAHQRFFRHMCMAAKVPAVVRMSHAALAANKCVVIGLQSTGEARTADVIADRGEELDDFVSGPKELLLKLVEDHYPLPPNPADEDAEAGTSSSDEDFEGRGTRSVLDAAARGAIELREGSSRHKNKEQVRYREYHSDEEIGITSSEEEDDEEEEEDSDGEGSESDSAGSGDGKQTKQKKGDKKKRGTTDTTGNSDSDDDQSSGVSSDPSFDPTRKAIQGSDTSSDSGDDEDNDNEAKDESSLTPEEQERLKARRERREQRKARREQRRLQQEAEARRKEAIYTALSEGIQRRDELRAIVSEIELPANPLDDLIDRLGGPNKVAEMTGRKGRLVRDEAGTGTVKYEPRNASGVGAAGATLEMINVHERGLFLNGDKYVAIISEAASAGISLHADRRVPNQRRRVHLTLELPWSADKAIQQFGRSHRANQAHAPQYRLIFTPLGGEKRFASAVARRLESLGALTQGDRRAGPSLAAFNYESTWGQRALRETYAAILAERNPPTVLPLLCRPGPDGEPASRKLSDALGKMRAQLLNCGLLRPNFTIVSPIEMESYLKTEEGAPTGCGSVEDRDRTDIPRFLNRLLGLEPDAQAEIFDYFQVTMDELVDKARREGALDEGIMDLRAHSIVLDGEPQELHKDPSTGAASVLYTIKCDRGLPWTDAEQLLVEHKEREVLEAEGLLLSPGGGAGPTALLAAIPVAESNQPAAVNGDDENVKDIKDEDGVEIPPSKALFKDEEMEEEEGTEKDDKSALQKEEEEEDNDKDKEEGVKSEAEENHVGSKSKVKKKSPLKKEEEEEKADKDEDEEMEEPETERATKRQKRGGKEEKTTSSTPAADDGKPSKPKVPSESPREAPSLSDGAIDLTGDSDDDDNEADATKKTPVKKEQKDKKEESMDIDGVTDSVTDDEKDKPSGSKAPIADKDKDKDTKQKKKAKPEYKSGFYRAKMEGIKGRVYVLLALQVPGSSPASFNVYRPTTGRSRQLMQLQELKSKYIPLDSKTCEPLWIKAYDAAATGPEGKPGVRLKTVHILGGAVMRSWGAVQRALIQHLKPSERRVRVMRIMTTGEDRQRLVGMLVPEPVVKQVVGELTGQEAEEEEEEEDGVKVEEVKKKEKKKKGGSKGKKKSKSEDEEVVVVVDDDEEEEKEEPS